MRTSPSLFGLVVVVLRHWQRLHENEHERIYSSLIWIVNGQAVKCNAG